MSRHLGARHRDLYQPDVEQHRHGRVLPHRHHHGAGATRQPWQLHQLMSWYGKTFCALHTRLVRGFFRYINPEWKLCRIGTFLKVLSICRQKPKTTKSAKMTSKINPQYCTRMWTAWRTWLWQPRLSWGQTSSTTCWSCRRRPPSSSPAPSSTSRRSRRSRRVGAQPSSAYTLCQVGKNTIKTKKLKKYDLKII